MAKIVAVCKSEKKGTRKKVVVKCEVVDGGLAGDAHADCCTHRQVSLLAIESIDKMRAMGLKVGPGSFAENLTTEGIFGKVIRGGTVKTGDEIVTTAV